MGFCSPQSGNIYYIYYCAKADDPERIRYCELDTTDSDWQNWSLSLPSGSDEILSPQLYWEGVAETVTDVGLPGDLGEIKHHVLRDPYPFYYNNIQYVFYVGGGEQAIGLAKII